MYEQIVGYELLYRNKQENRFPEVDSDIATIDVLVNSFYQSELMKYLTGSQYS